jgi:hypothetical protein
MSLNSEFTTFNKTNNINLAKMNHSSPPSPSPSSSPSLSSSSSSSSSSHRLIMDVEDQKIEGMVDNIFSAQQEGNMNKPDGKKEKPQSIVARQDAQIAAMHSQLQSLTSVINSLNLPLSKVSSSNSSSSASDAAMDNKLKQLEEQVEKLQAEQRNSDSAAFTSRMMRYAFLNPDVMSAVQQEELLGVPTNTFGFGMTGGKAEKSTITYDSNATLAFSPHLASSLANRLMPFVKTEKFLPPSKTFHSPGGAVIPNAHLENNKILFEYTQIFLGVLMGIIPQAIEMAPDNTQAWLQWGKQVIRCLIEGGVTSALIYADETRKAIHDHGVKGKLSPSAILSNVDIGIYRPDAYSKAMQSASPRSRKEESSPRFRKEESYKVSEPSTTVSTVTKGRDCCFNYNSGKECARKKNCNYAHCCLKCFGNHPRTECQGKRKGSTRSKTESKKLKVGKATDKSNGSDSEEEKKGGE